MPKKNHAPAKRKSALSVALGIVLLSASIVVALAGFIIIPQEEKQPEITEQILGYSGYTRVIGQQEYKCYEHLARREMDDDRDSKLLAQNTKKLAQTANAQFFLGNKLGLYGPYSFEYLQEQMKHENAARAIKKEQGQAIYGPEVFDIYTYYQYVSSNLEVDIIDYLATHADASILAKTRTYFEENKKDYDHPEQVVYTLSENANSEVYTLDWRQLNSLESADSQLAHFLREGSENQEWSYMFGKLQRNVKIQSVTYVKTDFEQQKTTIVSDFLKNGYYKKLLQEIEKNNPVAFSENI
ncbi:hypothetical protein ACDZ28_18520 [Paenibacillus sp. RS8]|uniref:hypothetical protein n=1 Tax=Paenibacillus sp. RS8 TaxID=3242681 RepID=UPI0035C1DE96